jgi:hypothetical protein
VNGMLRACRGHHHEALQEFSAAEHLGSRLADSHALASQVTGWMLAAQARAAIGALADERVGSSEIHNARAAICLAERDPAGALARCGMSWTARHRLSVTSRSSRLSCWPASPIVSSVSVTGPRRCSARGSCSCYRPTVHTSPAVTGSR